MKREVVFKIIAILLPFVFLLLLELLLRFVGYGDDRTLFVDNEKDSRFLQINDKVSLRYFLREENATSTHAVFLKNKPENLTRIFVQGESTALGVPYDYNVSFPRMAEYQLRNDFPDLELEVINLSMTALSSFALNDFADEIIKQKPDAVIINAGQNEYYGALGVGSTSNILNDTAIKRLVIAIRKTRIGQLAFNFVKLVSPHKANEADTGMLMKRMVKDQEIPFGSKEYYAGIRQFEKNLNSTLKKYKKADIKVFLTNPVTNIKGQRPFISLGPDSLNAQKKFESAQAYYANKEFVKAKEEFIRAKELDALRFRAPEKIDSITRCLAEKYDNVVFVDIRKALEDHTEDGIIGYDLITEHVHPNIKGYYLIAGALVKSFKENSFLYKPDMADKPLLAQNEMPLTGIDSLRGAYTIEKAMKSWPFSLTDEPAPDHSVRQASNSYEEFLAGEVASKKIHWIDAMYKLLVRYEEENDPQKGLKAAEATVLVAPEEYIFYLNAINLSLATKNYAKGIHYLKRAEKLSDRPDKVSRSAFALYMMADDPELALPYLYNLSGGDGGKEYRKMTEMVPQIIEYRKKLAAESGNAAELKNKIYSLYTQIGYTETALKYLDK